MAAQQQEVVVFAEKHLADIAVESETWLTVEICVRSDSPHAAELKEICDEMLAHGIPVYVSVSKRGTPYKAG